MDIFNRPPAIAEDTLQYILHPGPSFTDKSSVTTLTTVIDSHVSSVLPNHIWHRDAFELKLVSKSCNQVQWNIEGRMRVGDCVDDEWCVVWLLRDISQRWDVAVSVFDSDGDFLLIEAADYLPGWVTPTNSENRVWLYQGRLHLVPLQHASLPTTKRELRRLPGGSGSDDEGAENAERDGDYISISDAIQAVRNPKVNTLAPPEMENAAFRRSQGYPALALRNLHRTKAYVPRDIALALSTHPTLVQKATEAFYTRDAIQLRAATRMARFAPDSSVLTTVTLTRTAYAQLVGQRFHPPKVFGECKEREGTREQRWRDLGMKIACGFEMLYQESKGRQDVAMYGMDGSDVSLEARKEALRRDPEYVKYLANLQGVGYFKDEAVGSAVWKDQENRAATQFINARQVDNANRPSFAYLVNAAVSQVVSHARGTDPLEFVREEEESDDWLTVDESTVDGLLMKSLRPETSSTAEASDMDVDEVQRKDLEEKMAAEQAGQLRKLADKVENFVQGEGDVEGARFEDDLLSDKEEMSEFSDSDDEGTPDSPADEIQGAASPDRQAAMDKLVPALEPFEYGKMPHSYHSNSQKVKKVTIESEMVPVDEPSKRDASPQPKPMRSLIFPRDQFDGVEDSDDESEEGGAFGEEEEEGEEEDRPMVVGEVEIDMQEEEEDFLKFSREALGISQDMWDDIIRDRKGRGAFLPNSALRKESEEAKPGRKSAPSGSPQPAADSRSQNPDSGPRPKANSNLNSFEAVMQAMDNELSRAKRRDKGQVLKQVSFPGSHSDVGLPIPSASMPATDAKKASARSSTSQEHKAKGKQEAEDDDEDVGSAMDAELRAALRDAGEDDEDEDEGDEGSMDYTLIKNFLESFKSQQGLSGPVGNLVGRLQPGWQLPRDES